MKRLSYWLTAGCLSVALLTSSCSDKKPEPEAPATPEEKPTPEPDPQPEVKWTDLTASPDTWDGKKRADITYQLLVYSFADSDGDGTGDFNGLIGKLDYLHALGVRALWLSPIHPAMSYHGYDVTDYTTVNPAYGTMADFTRLVEEAHKRDIRIYLDYVMNHTGKDHPWFQHALSAADSPYRDYYLFSTNPAADIAAGRLAMVATEGEQGYNASQWFAAGQEGDTTVKGIYRFVLDWSDAEHPTLTVSKAETADAENTTAGKDDRYLWFGNSQCKRFYNKGGGRYELTLDFASDWGFLVRTTDGDNWGKNYKWGAAPGTTCTLDQAFPLDTQTAGDIRFDFMQSLYYHSHFATSWFADLNYGPVEQAASSPAYQAIAVSAKEWMDRGVDGLRLDAVKHIYHNENSDENPRFLKTFYEEMNDYYRQQGHTTPFYMVGEVLSEAQQVAPYYAGLPALFEFSFWYRLEWAINQQTGRYFAKDVMGYRQQYAAYRTDYIEATKLSNHDEDRTASKLGKSVAKEKLAAAVLLTAAGSPYLYYGEELGLYGTKEKGDEYVRGPMLWGDGTETRYTDKTDASVAESIADAARQQADTSSLLHTYLTFTRLRNTYPALAEGDMERHPVYNEENAAFNSLAAWYRSTSSQRCLVVHNFGNSEVTLPLTDTVEKVLAVQGDVQQKTEDTNTQWKMGACASVVCLLK